MMLQVHARGFAATLLWGWMVLCAGCGSEGGDRRPPPKPGPEVTLPGAPTDVQALAGVRSAQVSWTAPSSNGGSAIVKYTVTCSGGVTTTTTGATNVVVSGLVDGTRYTFQVRATNAVGDGPESGSSPSVTTLSPPGAPRILDVIPGNSTLRVSWAPPDADGGAGVPSYSVELLDAATPRSQTTMDTGVELTGLTPETEYQVIVRAVNAVGMGPPSEPRLSKTRCDHVGWTKLPSVPVEAELRALVAGDFDPDGKPDLAGTRMAETTVASYLGQGEGRLRKQGELVVGAEPQRLLTGDFNGDSVLDLAVLNTRSMTVSVLPGFGDGAFSAGRSALTGAGPWSMTTADLDGDGALDVLTVNTSLATGSSTLSWMQGNGFGSLTRQDFNLSFVALTVTTADFDGDGHLDVALPASLGSDVYVYFGSGDSNTFRSGARYSAQNQPKHVAAADFNHDGRADLLVTSKGDGFNAPAVSVGLGRGNGTFDAAKRFNVLGEVGELLLADFDRDGHLDVAVTHDASKTVSFLRGLGDGSFAARQDVVLDAIPRGLAAGNFSGGDRLELMVSQLGSTSLSLLTTACLP
ncbi:FG-GAP-like repeat-containing protein [Myxococcus sp. K38C18041901]|uniref:FG-GAP-like repeat-containing protein n=1 Tax=Myxococcus guangdongensis TaxID=2906760 RepID=UPI0020A80BE1|nr:FG-GAP-like repeat-containing protein [Myxococcus guangdongensis]MCP3063798.1 FG-GAP-like repeat-containing protein [Myxococcus guangdongensis]